VFALPARLPTERGPGLRYYHDLLSARVVTDEVNVPNQGRVVEQIQTKDILQHPTGRIHREAPRRGGGCDPITLAALAIGLFSHGLYCLLEARYRDLTPGR